MSIQPIKRHGLTEEISFRILDLVQRGHFKPGDKLPPERELAEQLEVSRPSLREAMSSLAFMNVVEIRQGSGTYITSLEPDLLSENLEHIFTLGKSTVVHVMQCRNIVEPDCAALAAGKITPEQIEQLRAIALQTREHTDDLVEHAELDIQFHLLIVEAANNPLLKRFLSSITVLDRTARAKGLSNLPDGYRQERIRQAYEDHIQVVKALESKDAEASRAAMKRHLEHVEVSFQAAGLFDATDIEDLSINP